MTYEFFIFRHGETDWNKETRFQGQTDILLNGKGKEQARALSFKVKGLGIETIVSSDLKRAHETANIAFSKSNLSIVTTRDLREINLGEAEGLTKAEVLARYGERQYKIYASSNDRDMDYHFPGGETKRELVKRVKKYLEGFAFNHSFKKIAVSTHGGVLFWFCHSCEGAPNDPIPAHHCALYKVIFENNKWLFMEQLT